MGFLIEVLLGVAVAGIFILVARRTRYETLLLAAGLVVAALVYVAFSFRPAGHGWHLLEVAGVALFGLLAVLGVKVSRGFLAAGWLLHVGWDVFLHAGPVPDFVPAWYPGVCVGFDLLVAAYAALSRPVRL